VTDALRFECTVSPECKLVPRAPATWLASLSELRGQPVIVSIAKPKKLRSLRANAYWHACITPIFQEIWSLGRTKQGLPPYDRDETHEVLVQVLAGYEDGPLPGTRVRARTSEMDSVRFAKLVDDARELALHNYGVTIPAPGETFEAA
jgi:hypothetical protein